MLKRILRTMTLVIGVIVYLPALIVETVAAILIAFAGGELTIKDSITFIASQYRVLWGSFVGVFNVIWDKDETEEEEAE